MTSYFYVPEVETDQERLEQFSSEQEVLSWIKNSPDRAPDKGDNSQLRSGPIIVPIEESSSSVPAVSVFGNRRFKQSFKEVAVAGIKHVRENIPRIKPLVFLSQRVLRRILAAKESLFKFGTFVPSNDREADASPEAHRWQAGRALEWFRLTKQGTFDATWTVDRMNKEFPTYRKKDIGFLFYVYDFKFSGEHRVRLVFDGSCQSETTFKETYAPTVLAESVRLFHIVCVQEGHHIGQYDVPQAFLKADIDYDIFVYPPKGQSEFPGQILKLKKALYGGKQSAYLWFSLMNSFLLELGFVPSR